MNTSIAIATPLLVALLWLFTRRQPRLSRSSPASGPVSSPSLLQPSMALGASAAVAIARPSGGAMQQSQLDVRGRAQRLAQASAALSADPAQRQQAMEQLGRWGDRAALPLLKRGLRDPHPQVVLAAAQAMERFRGRSAGSSAVVSERSSQRLPRNARLGA